jgi:hypothetical protein
MQIQPKKNSTFLMILNQESQGTYIYFLFHMGGFGPLDDSDRQVSQIRYFLIILNQEPHGNLYLIRIVKQHKE